MAHILRRKPWDIDQSVTPEKIFLSRRTFMRNAGSLVGAGSAALLGGCGPVFPNADAGDDTQDLAPQPSGNLFIQGPRNERFTVDRDLTAEDVAATFNNFYEFTTSKTRVWELAQDLVTRPWTVEVGGAVARPGTYDFDDIVRNMPIEERVYRLRCVETWSMTVPWMGFPFRAFLDWVEPTSSARFVRFETFFRPGEASGQMPPSLFEWPYYEGITIEEAANELSLMAIGIYGHELPNQHGAPLRLVLPWKYGYKSIKSIVRIEFTETQPPTFWTDLSPLEYDFWANVDPGVPHPRWSQAEESPIGTNERIPTLPYNGYGAFAHGLYEGTLQSAM